MKKLFKFFTSEALIIFLILVFAFILRAPFFNEPLDYDEGTYAFFAFFSKGEKFYSSLPIGRLPGIIFTYRFLDNFFPGNIVAFRITSALLIVLATLIVYKFGKLFYGRKVGLIASLIFAILASRMSPTSTANTELFMMPFTVLAFWFFWLFQKKSKIVWLCLSGLSIGIAIFYKQIAVFELFLLGLWLLFSNIQNLKRKTIKILGQAFILGIFCLIPFLFSLLFFFLRGELNDFWWQSFGSGSSYVAYAWQKGWILRLINTAKYFWVNFWPFCLTLIGGLILVFFGSKKEDKFLLLWFVFSLLGAFFNGWFFLHYFVQILPAFSILGGLFLTESYKFINSKINIKYVSFIFLLLFFFLMIKNQIPYLLNYYKFIKREFTYNEYLGTIGRDIGEAGWPPLHQGSEYLKKVMDPQDNLFVWSTTPIAYYLVRKYPTTSFIQNYPLLDYQFMLPTSKSWKFDFENNRKKLIEELKNKPPEYILMQIGPEQIFDQMFLFQDFGRFVSQNYNFEKKFGNILIFKIKDGVKITKSDLPIIPLELIKYYSAITKVDYRDDQTEVTFEPMVNPNGILRIFKTIYPSTLNVNFEPITIKILGQDGSDFVGNSFLKPSGTIDLHFQIEGVKEGIIFARIKADNITYNNKSYGVNYALKLIEHENLADLYIEPPLNWKGKNLEIYFICEDGSLAKTYANL